VKLFLGMNNLVIFMHIGLTISCVLNCFLESDLLINGKLFSCKNVKNKSQKREKNFFINKVCFMI